MGPGNTIRSNQCNCIVVIGGLHFATADFASKIAGINNNFCCNNFSHMAGVCMCVSTLFCWFLWPMFVDSKLAKIDICLICFAVGPSCKHAPVSVCWVVLWTPCVRPPLLLSQKTDHMAIWTKILSKFEQFDQKHDQHLGFDFLLIRISRKILNLKLVENWLGCMLFILTRPWHDFRTRNVRMCLRPVLAWCPLLDTKTVSQCPSDGQKRDVASDVKYVWWRHDQTDVTIIKTRQSAMVKGNSMSQLVRTFDRGLNTQPGSQFVDLICFLQIWSLILEDDGTDTRQSYFRPDPLSWKIMALTHVSPVLLS